MVNGGGFKAGGRPKQCCHHPRKRVAQYSRARKILIYGGDYWFPAFAGMTGVRVAPPFFLLLRREDPVAAGVQADRVAGPELAVTRRVDLDQRGAVVRR